MSRDYRPLINLIGRTVEAGLDLYLSALLSETLETYLPVATFAQMTGYDAAYLSWLVQQGRIAGTKRGQRWFTTEAAVRAYQQEVESGLYKPGRPKQNPKSQKSNAAGRKSPTSLNLGLIV